MRCVPCFIEKGTELLAAEGLARLGSVFRTAASGEEIGGGRVLKMTAFFQKLGFACALFCQASMAEESYVEIQSGSIAGVYYPIAVAICDGINAERSRHGIRCAVEATGGSVENISRVVASIHRLGFVQSDQIISFERSDPLRYRNLVVLATFQDEVLHIMVRSGSGISSIEDFASRTIAAGEKDSGSEAVAEEILEQIGLEFDESVFKVDISPSEQGRALCEGQVDGIFWVAAIPNQSVVDAMGLCDVEFVGLSESIVSDLGDGGSGLFSAEIERGAYPGVDRDVETVGTAAKLVSNANVPEEAKVEVYKFIRGNVDFLRRLHPSLGRITLESVIGSLD